MKQAAFILIFLSPFFMEKCLAQTESANSITTSSPSVKKFRANHITLAFTNAHTALPFSKFIRLVTGEIHPGFEVGTGITWKAKKKQEWFQTFKFGYSYHKLVQHSLVFYTETGYRYHLAAGLEASIKIGGGYMRAIIANQVFSDGQDNEKQYAKITSGRSQAILTASTGISKTFRKPALGIFLEYQQRLQTPFIKSYVPLLPYNILLIGVTIPLKK